MAWISCLGPSAIAGLLIAAPIGDTTVLLLFALSLEGLLALMLVRERHLRFTLGSAQAGGEIVTPFPMLARTVPHLRARRIVVSHRFVMTQGSASGWRDTSQKATF